MQRTSQLTCIVAFVYDWLFFSRCSSLFSAISISQDACRVSLPLFSPLLPLTYLLLSLSYYFTICLHYCLVYSPLVVARVHSHEPHFSEPSP
ncbi:hypothetical protein DFH05DRAFT_495574 [Lentinula detonsa]|uniref:Uncharacterized protein n=1 Tax=Lentinula detonsa TaxID=2804962 RepID=A0A9W8NS54_9AGAR|nr:hypothetical protein DFH05DRAFT_495574 [Lentinula detonsa]